MFCRPTRQFSIHSARHTMSSFENLRSKNRQLFPAISDQEEQSYHCECPTCQVSSRYRDWLPRCLAVGFFVPIIWLTNLGIFMYTQWHLDSEPTHSQIPLEEMPTVYEVQTKIEKTHLQLSPKTVQEINHVNDFSITLQDSQETLACPQYDLIGHRNKFLRQVALTILDSHESLGAYYRKWTLRTLLAMLCYAVTMTLLVMAYRPRWQ